MNTDAQIVGINNRDLRTFQTNLNTTVQLRKLIPQDKVVVSESGIHFRQDVKLLQECGINAILVGESLMRSADINAKIKELIEG